jgi:hypothetical protein
MAYTSANLNLVVPSFTNATGESGTWTYYSTDNATTVDVPGYFSDALAKGVKVNDLIYVVDSDASPVIVTAHRAVSYSGTTLTISTGDTLVTGTSGS